MRTDIKMALFMQVLTEKIVKMLHLSKDIEFVTETLNLTNDFLIGKTICPDLLYSHLENLDEEDILTYFDLDKVSKSEVWTCIADAVAYICLLDYEEVGEEYLPETIESVDEGTLIEFFDNYKKCLQAFEDLSEFQKEILNDSRVDLESDEVKEKYQFLFP